MTGNPRTVSLELFQILRQFAAVVPISQIYFPPHLITQSTHDFLLRLICENPHFEAFPPAFSYRRSFWKWTIRHLESACRFLRLAFWRFSWLEESGH